MIIYNSPYNLTNWTRALLCYTNSLLCMLSQHFVNEKRKLYFHLPNKSKWVLSYSTKGIKLSSALNFTFMSIHVLEFAKMSWFSILANNNKQKRELPPPKKWQNWGSQKKVFKPRRHGHLSFLSSVNCQMPNLTFFVLWLLSANFWLGLYILNFLSILSDFFSWEKLAQKWLLPKAEQFAKL